MNGPTALTPEQEERLARWRGGAMSDAEREAFEREVLASDALAEAAYSELALDAIAAPGAVSTAEAPARAARAPLAMPLPRRRSWAGLAVRVALPIAAGLLLVWIVPRWRPGAPATGVDTTRGAGASVQALSPTGDLASPLERFTWTRDAGATSYRVELFDADGNLVAARVTPDTTLASTAFASHALDAGEWRVVPIDADGAERQPSERLGFRAPRR